MAIADPSAEHATNDPLMFGILVTLQPGADKSEPPLVEYEKRLLLQNGELGLPTIPLLPSTDMQTLLPLISSA